MKGRRRRGWCRLKDRIVGDSRSDGDDSRVAQGYGDDTAANAFVVDWIKQEFLGRPANVWTYDAGIHLGEGNDKGWGDNNGPNGATDTTTGGDDDIYGGSGTNDLFGGPANDRLFGGTGEDNMFGGAGSNTCDGGGGANDTFQDCN